LGGFHEHLVVEQREGLQRAVGDIARARQASPVGASKVVDMAKGAVRLMKV
jgi:hypothetical protein